MLGFMWDLIWMGMDRYGYGVIFLFALAPVSGTRTGLNFLSHQETFAKLSRTTIMCLDSQSPKLGFHYGFPPTRE